MAQIASPRIRARQEDLAPRVLVRALLALVLAILSLVVISMLTQGPGQSTAKAEVIQERVIYLSSEVSGASQVLDADGAVLANLPLEKGGFVAGIDRIITRERARNGAATDAPVLLRLGADNRLSLHDPETGWNAVLMGFGPDNLRTFAKLLEPNPKGGHHGTTD